VVSHQIGYFYKCCLPQLLRSHPHLLYAGLIQTIPLHKLLVLGHFALADPIDLRVELADVGSQAANQRRKSACFVQHGSEFAELSQSDRVAHHWLKLGQIAVAALADELDLLLTTQRFTAATDA
jgi:hypothetical protein